MVGYLFAPNGENITSRQVKKLKATNKELAAMAAVETTNDLPAAATAPNASAPAATQTPPVTEIFLPAGERLMKELGRSSGVTLGAKADAPLLYVLLSPSCDACKTFWKSVRDLVQKGALRVRLFPAGITDSEDERASGQLLRAADPLAAWDKYANGDASALAGVATPASLDQVRATTALITRWSLPTAPYILYRAKNGQVKVVQGAPEKPQAVIDDIAPEKPEAKP
jgi:protein-disulfide isomerase